MPKEGLVVINTIDLPNHWLIRFWVAWTVFFLSLTLVSLALYFSLILALIVLMIYLIVPLTHYSLRHAGRYGLFYKLEGIIYPDEIEYSQHVWFCLSRDAFQKR